MADWTSDTIPKNIMETLVVDDLAVNYEISAGTIQAKNAATAWVNFDGTTTPPTIRDSFNVKDVVRTATGVYKVYFEKEMKNDNYSSSCSSSRQNSYASADGRVQEIDGQSVDKMGVRTSYISSTIGGTTGQDMKRVFVQIFGGK